MIQSISAIQSVSAATAATPATAAVQPAADAGATFSSMLHSVVQQSAQLDNAASRSVTGLLRGDGTDVHQAMIATQKAEIAFEMAMQIRNRAVNAYQQLMQMQF